MATCNTNYGSLTLLKANANANTSNANLRLPGKSICKSTKSNLILALIFILLICIIGYYLFTKTSTANATESKTFLNGYVDSIQAKKEPQTIVIEYEYEDYLQFSTHSPTPQIPFESDVWSTFHSHLITQNGFDVNEKSNAYVFQVYDQDYHGYNVARTPRPTKSPNPRPTRSPNTMKPTKPIKTERPTKAPNTPTLRPTKSPNPRPTRPPNTLKPTKPIKIPKTPRPTKLVTARPTKVQTERPTKVVTPRPSRSPNTKRPTKKAETTGPTIAPTAASNLKCFTRYTFGIGQAGYMEPGASISVDCLNEPGLGKAQLMGCITYAPGNNGFTSGEIIKAVATKGGLKDAPKCEAWHRDSGNGRDYPIGIGARCCVSSINKDELYVNMGIYENKANTLSRKGGEYCNALNDCNNWAWSSDKGPVGGAVPMMCTTYFGQWHVVGNEPGCITKKKSSGNLLDCGGWTGINFGTKFEQTTGCQGSRGEVGYLSQRSGCVGSIKGVMDCQWISSNAAKFNIASGKFESFAKCSTGYVIADCNSYVDVAVDMCAESDGSGISYGGYFQPDPSIQECIAVGSSVQIRAQASCCKVS